MKQCDTFSERWFNKCALSVSWWCVQKTLEFIQRMLIIQIIKPFVYFVLNVFSGTSPAIVFNSLSMLNKNKPRRKSKFTWTYEVVPIHQFSGTKISIALSAQIVSISCGKSIYLQKLISIFWYRKWSLFFSTNFNVVLSFSFTFIELEQKEKK